MSTALSLEVKKMLAIPTIRNGDYAIAAESTLHFLSEERAMACMEEMIRISNLENYETIEHLRDEAKMTLADEHMCTELSLNAVVPAHLTLDEAKQIHKFIIGTDKEIMDQKVGKIVDMLTHTINGVRNRRDYIFSDSKSKRLQELLDKGMQYDRGEYDVGLGFDITVYPKEKYDCEIELLRSHTLTFTLEELVDQEYIDEEDVLVIGPYSYRDMHDIEYFSHGTWSQATSKESLSRLDSLLEEKIYLASEGVAGDIHKSFISDLVLPSRRLSAKNLVALASSFGQQCATILNLSPRAFPTPVDLTQLKSLVQSISYFAGMICRMRPDDIKEKYKLIRTTDEEFFKELLSIAESWSVTDEAMVESDFKAQLLHLDDVIFKAQAEFAKVTAKMKAPTSTSNVSAVKALLT